MREQLIAMLFREYLRAPPPGYYTSSIDRVRRAYVEVSQQMQEQSRSGISFLPDGRMPLDLVLPGIKDSSRTAMLLMPLPAAAGSKRKAPSGDIETSRPTKKPRTGKAKARSDTSAKGRDQEVGKSLPMPPSCAGSRRCTVINASASPST